jgi:hypothetical protein
MSDRSSASITIGGTLSPADYVELTNLIVEHRLAIEWDGYVFEADQRTVGEPLSLFAHDVLCGRFEGLEAWCVAKGLPFARWNGGCLGVWGPARVVFTGAGAPLDFTADEDDVVVVNRRMIEALGTLDAILAHFDAADLNVPPLVIAGVDA